MSPVDQHKKRIEQMKLLYDINKHITTLSMGALVLMIGFFDKILKVSSFKLAVYASFIFFVASVVCCVFAMFGFALYSRKFWKTENDPVKFGLTAFMLALVFFVFGVVWFAVFIIKNI